jgi:hypothetical protein
VCAWEKKALGETPWTLDPQGRTSTRRPLTYGNLEERTAWQWLAPKSSTQPPTVHASLTNLIGIHFSKRTRYHRESHLLDLLKSLSVCNIYYFFHSLRGMTVVCRSRTHKAMRGWHGVSVQATGVVRVLLHVSLLCISWCVCFFLYICCCTCSGTWGSPTEDYLSVLARC